KRDGDSNQPTVKYLTVKTGSGRIDEPLISLAMWKTRNIKRIKFHLGRTKTATEQQNRA
ncbi:hypothetical protein HHI36_007583, partial [Cryptolaemus montrouzieri]